MVARLLRRLLHIHSPSLLMMGRDPVVSQRWVSRCGLCAEAFAPPLTAEQQAEVLWKMRERAHQMFGYEED